MNTSIVAKYYKDNMRYSKIRERNKMTMKTILITNPSHTFLRLIGMIVVFLGCIASTFAQTQISGTITDETGEAIPGVTVVIQGTSQGSVTGIDGTYAFSTSLSGDYVLSISFVGYKTILQPVTLGSGDVSQDFQLELDMIGLDEVVVTGVVNPKSKLESSVSVTTLNPKTIVQSAPRTTAEIFRTIPGIKAEASAGDGNTNITVRGVPISAGGSRYLQLQEDGLPVLLYGDIAFSTQDQYVRADQTIARIEAIRGGSAATTTSNGPAGIINFISKNGSVEGGSVGTSFGVNYNSIRTDFEYGSPIGNNTSFHIGGFFRQGEGPRNANHTVNQGGQIKANLTKYFDKGLARVYYKMLNDRTAAYMPMPIQVSGTNSDPTWESVPGFDAVSNGLQTPFFQQNFGLGPDGNARNVDISDGLHTNTHTVGAYLEFDLPNDWTISSNSRMAFNSGRFVAPFTAQVGTTASIVEPILIANGDTTAAGAVLPYTMNRVANGSTFSDTPNGLIQRIHLFDVELENFNNFMSDTQLKKSFGELGVTFGLFKSYQNIEMSWLWNTYLMEVGEDADLVNVNANGADVTDDGLVNYGVPLWGNCCTGKYNTNYDVTAPYLSASYEVSDDLNIDASVRYDKVRVAGLVTPSQQVANFDINGNGTIDAPERSVSRVDNANAKIVNYSYDYVSYSFGANYLLSSDNAVFGRVSQGYVGNGERATWHQGGPYLENGAPKNSLFQAEVGYKKRFNNGGLFVTGFYAKTEEEAGVEATTQRVLSNDYRSYGLEIESNFRFNALDFRSAITYVDAEIVDNDGNTNIGNTPRRQPALQYNLLPSYNFSGGHAIGLSLIGQTKAYAQDNNDLIMPGYMIVNAYVAAQLSQGLVFSLNANNLTNTIGITESEEGSITENATNYIRARSIAGRSIMASLNLTF
ncbi:Outer membrane receptor proteins, mostly Fe transport [Ekhidna lutea]|uniref:Outer membrane receptor proteins, mostly Fe transport n=2 Tax=Ekhidna lutea TaxID=447679 RepID=A0A239GX56_EKHLU|nr:Outer membrane receptor proteins, mostly Fe transport [Ekhidna lutea]